MIFTKKRIRFLITACSAVSLSVLTSCDIFMAEWKKSGFYDQAENAAAEEEAKNFTAELEKPVTGVLSVHTLVRFSVGSENEMQVMNFYEPAKTIVESVPWLTSMDIEDVVPVERVQEKRGVYDLKLLLTANGKKKWEKMLAASTEYGYALLVDGVLYQTFKPRNFYDSKSREIILDGPFDEALCKKLHLRAPFNFLKLNEQARKNKGSDQ